MNFDILSFALGVIFSPIALWLFEQFLRHVWWAERSHGSVPMNGDRIDRFNKLDKHD
jgi:hypothetical protein